MALTLDRRAFMGRLAAAAAFAATTPPAAFARSAGRYAAVEAMLADYVAKGRVPGAVVAIVQPGRFRPDYVVHGRTAFEGGRPVDSRTLWRIYSQTKPITGVAVVQQAAAGRLALDTPLGDLLPEYGSMQVLLDPAKGLEARPATQPIRVRHLLTHTAGFTYHIAGDGPLEREYRRQGLLPIGNLGLGMSPLDGPVPDLDTFTRRLATLPLMTEPGAAYRYSLGLDVAGGLLQRLTGETLDRIFERQLFDPLGMRDTGFTVPAPATPRLSTLYSWRDLKGQPADPPIVADGPVNSAWARPPVLLAGGAGLVSGAADYARFAQMLLNDGLFEGRMIMPRAAARQTMANMMPPGLFFDRVKGYGAGGQSILFDTRAEPAGTVPGQFGWGGAAATNFHIDPLRQVAVVVMLQGLAAPFNVGADIQAAMNRDRA